METNVSEIKLKGKTVQVPSVCIDNRVVVTTGKWIRTATIQGEAWLEGEAVENPDEFISKLKHSKLKADIFTFVQKLPHTEPEYPYLKEWDNVAAIPITSFEEWWDIRLPQVTRKNVRRGQKRGVVAKVTKLDDELIEGIIGIHNDSPTRQGMPFAHYGKEADIVKKDYGSYLDRSEFLGAYLEDELIGIIKLVYMNKVASIMQILTKTRHYDKRPTNILIVKAVEICIEKGISFLVYGKYVYGNKTNSSLTEFKRRNGFEQIAIPRYYIPMTLRGKIAIKLKFHLGLLGILPSGVISFLRDLRSKYIQAKLRLLSADTQSKNGGPTGGKKGSAEEVD